MENSKNVTILEKVQNLGKPTPKKEAKQRNWLALFLAAAGLFHGLILTKAIDLVVLGFSEALAVKIPMLLIIAESVLTLAIGKKQSAVEPVVTE